MEKPSGKKFIVIGISVAVVAVIGVIIALIVSNNNKLKATTMRLLRRVNVVTLEDASGKEKAMTDNMKLQNGNALKTEVDSMVSVGLDEFKIVTVEENSRAEFYQSGKQLELNLTEGSLFIDVSQHLADDESFDVRTSTMTAGIRGTTIYVSQNQDGTWTMYLVSGALHVHGQHPITMEEKDVDIVGGQKVTAITFDDRETDTIILLVEEFSEEDMPLKLVEELVANQDALERAGSETGFDTAKIAGLAGVSIDPNTENQTETETIETESEAETETESSEGGEENGEGEGGEEPEGEGAGEGQEEEENLTNNTTNTNQNENVSDDGNTDEDVTNEESEATEESEEGFNAADYIAYIDENGIWHLKDGTLFDPNFYREMYGDALEEGGYITDEDMLRHYLEYGRDEKRFTTQESYDAFTEQYLAEKRAREEQERKEREEHDEWERQQQEANNSDSGENVTYETRNYSVSWASSDEHANLQLSSGSSSGTVTATYVDGVLSSISDIVIYLEDSTASANNATVTIPVTENRFNLLSQDVAGGDGFMYTDETYGEFHIVP